MGLNTDSSQRLKTQKKHVETVSYSAKCTGPSTALSVAKQIEPRPCRDLSRTLQSRLSGC